MTPTQGLPKIPIYLKTTANMPRPQDPEFYWMTHSGLFICRTHTFFSSDAPSKRMPGSLAAHQPSCEVRFPPLGVAALEYVVGFFREVYNRHGSEAVVLLLWDLERQRYRICVPRQRASVWQSYSSSLPCAIDVAYDIPTPLPPNHILIGDIHSHADLPAYTSGTDSHDERYRDGVHVVVGHIDRDPPDFHLEMAADGCRFGLAFEHFFRGYHARRRRIPAEWLAKVQVNVHRSFWATSYDDEADSRTSVRQWKG
jgi:hypothetical protein